jgi:hypothetical protein
MLVKLIFVLALVGSSKLNIEARPAAKPVTSPVARFETVTQSIPQSSNLKPKDDTELSGPALWLQSCTAKLAQTRTRAGAGEVGWFNNIGGNDVIFMPQKDPAEEIFDECMHIIPLAPDKVAFYKEWLYAQIAEMQALLGTTREHTNEILQQNGGIYTSVGATYSHVKCSVLKVRVEYEIMGTSARVTSASINDKVTAVSKPYLGLVYVD